MHPHAMFTGLIEHLGSILQSTPSQGKLTIQIQPGTRLDAIVLGESIAVNGCCLTVTSEDPLNGALTMDLAQETLRRTYFLELAIGTRVHLERALAVHARLGGHFVQGHVDDIGVIKSIHQDGDAEVLRIQIAPHWLGFVVEKGSITIDGISLTITAVHADGFSVMLVPYTQTHTLLCLKKQGAKVHLEFDVLAKYVARLMQVGSVSRSA